VLLQHQATTEVALGVGAQALEPEGRLIRPLHLSERVEGVPGSRRDLHSGSKAEGPEGVFGE
jgi:hypothetical protein